MNRKIPKPKKKVLCRQGCVSLLELTHKLTGVVIYAVEYPHKAGKDEAGRMQSQHLLLSEATKEYERFTQFFEY